MSTKSVDCIVELNEFISSSVVCALTKHYNRIQHTSFVVVKKKCNHYNCCFCNGIKISRFEAHMEVHVGSIDEEDDEQGIAHMIEHVAFLGSKKREKLLGTGARSNAYTDFHHTVFHIHSPTSTKVFLLN